MRYTRTLTSTNGRRRFDKNKKKVANIPDFSVTGIVTIDNTQSLLDVDEVMTAADRATARLATLRRKVLSTLSLTMGMINQGYTAMKQLVDAAGGMVDPMFDMLFSILSSVISTSLAAAIMWMSTMNPILVGVGIGLMILSVAMNVKTTIELNETKGTVKNFMSDIKMSIARSSHADVFRPSSGSGF